MIKIKKICKKYSLKLIEDCAHSIESKFNNKHAGTFGLAGCFSFYATKNITTGEGGMLVTNNKTVEQKVRKLSLHGMDVDAWKRYNKSGKYKYYSVTSAGYKYNLTNLQAALGINQLKEIENKWKKREKIWNYYQKELKNLPLILPKNFDKKKYKHAYHLYTLLIDTKKTRKTRTEIIDFLQANNIGIGVHYFSIQSFNFYKNKVKYNLKRLKYSTYVGNNTFSIPIYSDLKKDEMKHIVETIKKFFNV
jgi:dTDP-4-amino-4,6-dideoxygalactose transaminase